MGLTVKQENNFGELFDKFASLPDDVKKNVDKVKETKNKEKQKNKENK